MPMRIKERPHTTKSPNYLILYSINAVNKFIFVTFIICSTKEPNILHFVHYLVFGFHALAFANILLFRTSEKNINFEDLKIDLNS